MKKLILCCMIGILAALAGTAAAQENNPAAQPGTMLDNPIKQSFSLLDPSRLKIHHAYSFSYFSGGMTSGSVGMYRSLIQYQLARPLTLSVGLAYAHNPLTAFGGESGGLVREGLYPSFQLDYRPSPNFYIGIGYERIPYDPYYTPYFERFGGMRWTRPVDWWRTR